MTRPYHGEKKNDQNNVMFPCTGNSDISAALDMTVDIMRFYLSPPLNVNCPSSTAATPINAFIDADGNIVFDSAVAPCSMQMQDNGKPAPVLASE